MATGRDYTTINSDYGGLAEQVAANDIRSVMQRLIEKNLQRQPPLQIRLRSKFHVFITKDVYLRACSF